MFSEVMMRVYLNLYKAEIDKALGEGWIFSTDVSGKGWTQVAVYAGPTPPEGIHPKSLAVQFYMSPFAGCCGLCISHNAISYYPKRGIGTLFNRIRKYIAYQCGYTAMVCTDVLINIGQQKILENNEWEKVFGFTNRRTGNQVGMHVVKLDGKH